MFEVQFLIPAADNAGLPFDAAHDAAFESEAARVFGGVTRLPAAAVGQWTDGATTYRDVTRVYVVSVATIGRGGDVVALAAFARQHYGQLAIYVRYLGVSEII